MEHEEHKGKEFKTKNMNDLGHKMEMAMDIDKDKKVYPSISITDKEVPELKEVKVGDKVTIHAHCMVKSMSEDEECTRGTIEMERMGMKEGHNPFKSKAQQRLFYAAAGGSKKWRKGTRPEISKGKVKEYSEDTEYEGLPERVEKPKNKMGMRNSGKRMGRK